MRTGVSTQMSSAGSGLGLQRFMLRQASRLVGVGMLAGVAFALASLGTWNVADPSFSHATGNPVANAMGYPGAVFSDLAMQFYGLSSVALLAPAVIWGFFLASARRIDRLPKRGLAWVSGSVLAAGIAGCFMPPPTWPLPTGLGGVFGDMVLKLPAMFIGAYPEGWIARLIAVVLALPTATLFAYASALIARGPLPEKIEVKKAAAADADIDDDEEGNENEGGVRGGPLAMWGAVVHSYLVGRSLVRRKLAAWREKRQDGHETTRSERGGWRRAAQQVELAELEEARVSGGGRARVEPEFFAQMVAERRSPNGYAGEPDHDFEFDADETDPSAFGEGIAIPPSHATVQQFRTPDGARSARVDIPAPRPAQGARVQREAQTSFISSGKFDMPALHFLAQAKSSGKDPSLSKEALEQNARLLEGVLEDFGVKGEIIHVRPGPVVTLYELEPAPGIKSSRVIGLADDIARSMSAIACRVAVVPGRNAIGIELPNSKRETVYLREILASKDFEESKLKLALALGKSINGEVVTVDIAKMPHVLVAGTTGSGKSVAINTMILSLVYRMTPEKCRLIMIDPKMVELSVYDGIPHLLTPVVTEPKKAVVALKWTVREMEDRYRKMAKLGVRNQEGFNARVVEAKAKGESLKRTVQTGFDRQTGEAIYETEDLDLEPMPFIVVIIDEVADLMMVAGKDIEGAVQRLGQMARAAGIHVIMATQRPSVDVITGTIKANFPTRMSFQVTSKIDSRTILGEQGAEQLLGMGDMLYMAGGGRIQRVHGPFVSDNEVETVVRHLKAQGAPEYLDAITQDDENDEDEAPRSGDGGGGNFDESDDPYDQAVSIVLRDGKASTSYIQRRLGVGYNKAASIIERMEKEGIVGAANHAGKREILVPTEQDKM
jgi:S-DNA-T family DNA segregation ATPase FtsK/SpoIIIE